MRPGIGFRVLGGGYQQGEERWPIPGRLADQLAYKVADRAERP